MHNHKMPSNAKSAHLIDDASDNRYATMLQRYMKDHPYETAKLGSIKFCGSQLLSAPGWKKSVAILTNGERVKMFGLATCHSSWACPKCTAKVMAEYGSRIASAIDALQKWYHQSAVMFTFTLPHDNTMSAEDAFTILSDTWRQFAKPGNRGSEQRTWTRKNGTVTHYTVMRKNALGKMRQDLQIRHTVRVFEFTYGDNGWHPHIHALFWVPNHNLNKILSYEQELNELWWRQAKKSATRLFTKKISAEFAKRHVEELYADPKMMPGNHKSVYISRDPKNPNRPRVQQSSYYISGWSGDYELTANLKVAREGHFTPYQLLEHAWKCKADRNKYLALYVEYANATRGKRRFHFSARSGLNDIIRKWRLSNEYAESFKKKFMDKANAPWRMVVWFTAEQWSRIRFIDVHEKYLIYRIITLAYSPNAKQLITQLLSRYDIDISLNGVHPDQSFIENYTTELRKPSAA